MSYGAHSADVDIILNVNGLSVRVAQLGPDFIILHQKINHPPTEGEITLRVDASESRWKIFLPEGLDADSVRIPTVVKR
jgi:hypothetical protein